MFDYRAVSAATDHHINDGTPGASDDLDGGGDTDFFISFQVDMLTLIEAVRLSNTGAVLDAASGLRFLVGTSIQDNAFNQDLNGQNGNAVNKGGDGDPYSQANSGKTWAQLGAATDTYTASGGSPVPEPATYALLLGFAVLAAATVRRRR